LTQETSGFRTAEEDPRSDQDPQDFLNTYLPLLLQQLSGKEIPLKWQMLFEKLDGPTSGALLYIAVSAFMVKDSYGTWKKANETLYVATEYSSEIDRKIDAIDKRVDEISDQLFKDSGNLWSWRTQADCLVQLRSLKLKFHLLATDLARLQDFWLAKLDGEIRKNHDESHTAIGHGSFKMALTVVGGTAFVFSPAGPLAVAVVIAAAANGGAGFFDFYSAWKFHDVASNHLNTTKTNLIEKAGFAKSGIEDLEDLVKGADFCSKTLPLFLNFPFFSFSNGIMPKMACVTFLVVLSAKVQRYSHS